MVNARVDHIGIIPAGGQKLQTVADLSRHVFNFQSDAGFFLQHQIDIAVGNLVLAPNRLTAIFPPLFSSITYSYLYENLKGGR